MRLIRSHCVDVAGMDANRALEKGYLHNAINDMHLGGRIVDSDQRQIQPPSDSSKRLALIFALPFVQPYHLTQAENRN